MADEKNPESGGGAGESGTNGAATAAAAEIVAKKRGRPKGSTSGALGKPGSEEAGAIAQQRAELQAQFERLYDPRVWEGLVMAPADIALSITGDEIWRTEKSERETLAIQASITARCFVISDPKWLALSMLGVGLATTYGMRLVEYYAKKAKEKADEENRKE